MNISINQEASTYSLELMYSTKSSNQTDLHILAISLCHKKHFLAGQLLVEHQWSHRVSHNIFLLREDNSLEHNLNRFWEVESVEQSTMTADQQACEEHFLTHTIQQPNGRFVVKLPTKMEPNQLAASRLSAERRLHATERRLERDPQLKVQCHSFMKEYEDLGHMEPVKSQERKTNCYFLPHHPVFKATSSTMKTRVV
jgi:hypothetical protein